MGAEKVGLQPDGFPQQVGAFREPILLKADRAQNRTGGGSGPGVGERQLRLPVGFVQPTGLGQGGRLLESLLGLRGREGRRPQSAPAEERGSRRREPPQPDGLVTALASFWREANAPPRRSINPLGGNDIGL